MGGVEGPRHTAWLSPGPLGRQTDHQGTTEWLLQEDCRGHSVPLLPFHQVLTLTVTLIFPVQKRTSGTRCH